MIVVTPLDAGRSGSRTGGPSFTLSNRFVRTVWQIAWLVLARWTPPMLHPWRALLLRGFGARLGANCRVHASASIWLPSQLQLGNNVLIGPGVHVYNQGRIVIGSDTVVSQRAHLCASTHDVDGPQFQLELRPIIIGERCWVATEAFVGPGVSMGSGSVLAARCALFGNAEPWTIYRGNPAVPVRPRVQPVGEA